MSLIQQVARLIEEHGEGTVDSLLPHCDGAHANMVNRAIQNASRLGLIHCAGRAGPSAGKRTRMGIFKPGPAPGKTAAPRSKRLSAPAVNSDFALGGAL